ncbi:MAG: sulfatase [Verrucomicrobia bacterium]|nr:sulfatase [Verrucomicrobiota bacterium]
MTSNNIFLPALFALCFFGCVNVFSQSRPNVLFIVCDDLNTHVSTSDYPYISTPAFDELAERGMTFKRAYCQYPVCGPSRASFLSGLYPESTGVTNNTDDIRDKRPGTMTMPQAFREQGYWTAATGKVFHNSTIDPGEAVWDEKTFFENDEMPLEKQARKEFEAKHGSIEERKNRQLWKNFLLKYAPQTMNQTPGWGPSGLTDEQHRDGKNAAQAKDWIENKSYGDKPFFMAVGIHKPHIPFLAPDKYFDMYPKEELKYVKTPSNFWDTVPMAAISKRYEGFGFEFAVENDALRREYMQAYHACISFIDAQIGQIFDSLKANGLWENTIVVLTSDHGYHLGEHFIWGKVTLFEICNRVPLIIRVPGQTKPGSASQGLVELVDLFPTLAELCKVKTPEDIQGRSLIPNFKDPNAPGKKVAYTVVTRGKTLGKAIRTDRWRYALWPDGGEELYDLENDIEEHRNLVSSKDHSATLADMRKNMARAVVTAVSKRNFKL